MKKRVTSTSERFIAEANISLGPLDVFGAADWSDRVGFQTW
ncbi:hypothetical protein NC652_011620 [Populus alba x Populus x berolinensis]|nr:hypothetical protein NC652_011620 [Populus alba x Populus x berolinensis]